MKLDRSTLRAPPSGLRRTDRCLHRPSVGGGFLLDRWLGTYPLFLLVGILVGLVASFFTLRDFSRQFNGRTGGNSRAK